MKIAFFDTKPYDRPSFDRYGEEKGVIFKYFETKLNEDTVELADGYNGVCVFVNDTVNKAVIDRLYDMGVKVVALRCAGFNNVDIKYAEKYGAPEKTINNLKVQLVKINQALSALTLVKELSEVPGLSEIMNKNDKEVEEVLKDPDL